MRGLRTQEGKRFENFFELVQAAAKKQNAVFFLDCGEGREIETETLSGEDLSGWLIPDEKAVAFEKVFQTGDVPGEWAQFICFASWLDVDGTVEIRFLHF